MTRVAYPVGLRTPVPPPASPTLHPSVSRPRCAAHGLLVGDDDRCPRCPRSAGLGAGDRATRIVFGVLVGLIALGLVARAAGSIGDALTGMRRASASASTSAATPDGRLVVYTSPWCPYCRRAKAWLDERGIAYDERDVSSDRATLAEMQRLGGRVVPTFAMDGKLVQSGFDPSGKAVLEALAARQADAP